MATWVEAKRADGVVDEDIASELRRRIEDAPAYFVRGEPFSDTIQRMDATGDEDAKDIIYDGALLALAELDGRARTRSEQALKRVAGVPVKQIRQDAKAARQGAAGRTDLTHDEMALDYIKSQGTEMVACQGHLYRFNPETSIFEPITDKASRELGPRYHGQRLATTSGHIKGIKERVLVHAKNDK